MGAGLFGITITQEDCRPDRRLFASWGEIKHKRGIEKKKDGGGLILRIVCILLTLSPASQ
jgi:hypothetical protein